MGMDFEQLDANKLIGPQQDVETVESWADRNGLTYGTARAWAMKGVLPTVKLGKRGIINLLRTWLQGTEYVPPRDALRQ